MGTDGVNTAYDRLSLPLDQEIPPAPLDPLKAITKAAIKLGAKIDKHTGYLRGFHPISPDDVIDDDDRDEFDLENSCHKNCKCQQNKDELEDDPEFDRIEEEISSMGDSVTDPKQKCTMCQFFVGKIDHMFSLAARNAPIFIEEHTDSYSYSDMTTAAFMRSKIRRTAVDSFNALPPNQQVIVLAHVAAALVQIQAKQTNTDTDDISSTSTSTSTSSSTSTATTTSESEVKKDHDEKDEDDNIGSKKEEIAKAEEKGIAEGIAKEKGKLEPKEPTGPVRPPNEKERANLILTGRGPERGVTHAQWWLANDMFLNLKPLIYHKVQELCSERVAGSFADFCHPLFNAFDDIIGKLKAGTDRFEICVSSSFCTPDMKPAAPNDTK